MVSAPNARRRDRSSQVLRRRTASLGMPSARISADLLIPVGATKIQPPIDRKPLRRITQGLHGEFDPGSGRTLAACLTHASRAERPLRGYSSGERVSNTWATYLSYRDTPGKPGSIP